MGILCGILAHFLFYDLVRKTSLPDLYSYVVGVLVARPIFMKLMDKEKPLQAYDYAFAQVGIGVVIARVFRTVYKNGREKQ